MEIKFKIIENELETMIEFYTERIIPIEEFRLGIKKGMEIFFKKVEENYIETKCWVENEKTKDGGIIVKYHATAYNGNYIH